MFQRIVSNDCGLRNRHAGTPNCLGQHILQQTERISGNVHGIMLACITNKAHRLQCAWRHACMHCKQDLVACTVLTGTCEALFMLHKLE